MFIWQEIDLFTSLDEYKVLKKCIENSVQTGNTEEIKPDPDCIPGYFYGERWFLHQETGEIWRLVPPDFPFRGYWKKL